MSENDFAWSFKVEHADRAAVIVWEEVFIEVGDDVGKSAGYWLSIIDPVTGEKPVFDEVFTEAGVRAAAIAYRYAQLRQEEQFQRVRSEEALKEAVLVLFERAEAGEYLGQSTNSNTYVQDIAGVLDLPEALVMKAVKDLIEEKKIGLYGMILIPYSQYEDNNKYSFKRTGHRNYGVSEITMEWYCHACSQSGHLYNTDPKNFPCVPVENF